MHEPIAETSTKPLCVTLRLRVNALCQESYREKHMGTHEGPRKPPPKPVTLPKPHPDGSPPPGQHEKPTPK